jgi:hypothetical protein
MILSMLQRAFPIGTRSVLWGAHCWFIHPWFVALAWWRLFGFPRDYRLWVAFFVHDLGYVGLPNIDGDEGEKHVEWGARLMHDLFDVRWELQRLDAPFPEEVEDLEARIDAGRAKASHRQGDTFWFYVQVWQTQWRDLCLYHSRFYAKNAGQLPSRLCMADKLAVALEPWWLYLPRVLLSGEIHEFMAHARARGKGDQGQRSKYAGEPVVCDSQRVEDPTVRQWHAGMVAYLKGWVAKHLDGSEDTWTPAPGADASLSMDETSAYEHEEEAAPRRAVSLS